jgi:transcriptional regulator NrdR family protein
MYNPKDYTKVEQEILAAVGELIISKLKDRDDIAYAIFDTLVPQYNGYFPHHKVLNDLVMKYVKDNSEASIARHGNTDTFDN